MRTTRVLFLASCVVLSFSLGVMNRVEAKAKNGGAHHEKSRDAHMSDAERREYRVRRTQELQRAIEEFDAGTKRRWEQFAAVLQRKYDDRFSLKFGELQKTSTSRRVRQLQDVSRMNVVEKLPSWAARVHKEISSSVHDEAQKSFLAFIDTEKHVIMKFERELLERFPDLLRSLARKLRGEERKARQNNEDAMFMAWAAFCRASMLEELPRPGETYQSYFARMNSKYWNTLRANTERYIAQLTVPTEAYKQRMIASNQAYVSYLQSSNARYQGYLAASNQAYLARLTVPTEAYKQRMIANNQAYWAYVNSSTARYNGYLAVNTQLYFARMVAFNSAYWGYIQNSTNAYVNFLATNHQNCMDYVRYQTAIYFRRLRMG